MQQPDTISSRELLETIAGERCPCGHAKDDHAPPGPPIGNFTEVMGACSNCDCKGLLQ